MLNKILIEETPPTLYMDNVFIQKNVSPFPKSFYVFIVICNVCIEWSSHSLIPKFDLLRYCIEYGVEIGRSSLKITCSSIFDITSLSIL